MSARRGPVFREANVPVPKKWENFAFEYRIGFDAGTRFKKNFPAPGADGKWRPLARDAFRAGWKDARSTFAATAPNKPHECESRAVDATPLANSNECDL